MIHEVQYKNYSCECSLNPPTGGKTKKTRGNSSCTQYHREELGLFLYFD